MSKLWDDLKENMKEWGSSAVEKAEEMSKVAVAKTEELSRYSKIKYDIHQLNKEKETETEKLGQLVYDQAKQDNLVNFTGNSEFFNHVDKIDVLKEKIAEKEVELESVSEISEEDLDKDKRIDEDVREVEPTDVSPENPEENSEESTDDKPVESSE